MQNLTPIHGLTMSAGGFTGEGVSGNELTARSSDQLLEDAAKIPGVTPLNMEM